MALAGAAPGVDAGERWPQEVSSYAIDDGQRLLLFDPPAVPDALPSPACSAVKWLRRGGENVRWSAAGDRFACGIEAYAGREDSDLVLWKASAGAVIAGVSLADFGTGLALNTWLRGGVSLQQIVERLRPLLDLPVEVVCPAHGAPTDRAALERALALWPDER